MNQKAWEMAVFKSGFFPAGLLRALISSHAQGIFGGEGGECWLVPPVPRNRVAVCVWLSDRARLRQCRHEPKEEPGPWRGAGLGSGPALLLPGLVASDG